MPRAIDKPTALPPGGIIDPSIGDIAKIFAAPDDPADWPGWREDLSAWRREAKARLAYSGDAYDDKATSWASAAYAVAQVWLWDERLFDHERQEFTVDAFLESIADQGGLDGIVLWHAYPVIGIDDRNQFDYYRDVPGLEGVIDRLHARGLRVFVDYNPWDIGTRRALRSDADELASLVSELSIDGVFLDTMKEGDAPLIRALRVATPPQVLEGESRVPNQRIEDHQLSWAQWFADSEAPGVMRAHWYERRHMMHSTRRWNRDHSSELQSAWMNGTGMLVWDTVFGVWVGWNERDKATLRRMLRVQRQFSDLLIHGDWSPLEGATAAAIEAGIYVSRWSHAGATLWTIVNRSEIDWTGDPFANVPVAGTRRFDITTGAADIRSVTVPARGVTGVLQLEPGTPELSGLAALMAAAAADPGSADTRFPRRQAVRIAHQPGKVTTLPAAAIVLEPGARTLEVTFRRRETGFYQGAPYVEEWKPLPPRLHDQRSEQLSIAIDRPVAVALREVSVADFRNFLTRTGYRPSVDNRFLSGTEGAPNDAPVTGISLADARAYAAWAGARLPTEFEWQLAAEQPGFERSTPAVWNWTESEHSDGVTRFVMLKGGSDHRTTGSDWYTDGGVQDPSFSLKFLLPGLGIERSSSIGFRLAWDA
ncbi:SUMF1/EgtB/PvdO family nonheme iron enzyme [Arthrobacter sp. M4]|uniref:SUMF1/EgtB/PvdO family nonheme iron enzyme n=1 Tax=Arthrobacter sp. M4 TaxID=218160 RepID=UPI001CDD327D|nr:SUMF1/EgtB/PvdO family nonheme iron enzyme [Arthrobacter sp. M4]MCA4132607.1 formylglycine-generating enzyme family protein [Arthrobacter sp. M4]